MTKKRLFIVAGETSGDTHAARLIRDVKATMPDLRVEGLGGEKMRQTGCDLRVDLVSNAVMGFVQVAKNFGFFRRTLRETEQYIRDNRPDALTLVDYPGFNMRLAAAAKKLDIPVIYYISPQIWAWRPGRIKKIAEIVDRMIVILPFEEELYKNANVNVTYVGHPLLDNIEESELDESFLENAGLSKNMSLIGLMPGSRRQEIVKFLPTLIEAAKLILEKIPETRFLIPCSSSVNMEIIKEITAEDDLPIDLHLGKIYEVADVSRCCIVTSGTATLEVACFRTPLVVVYKTNLLLWLLSRRFLNVDHVSLVNILAGKEVVPEMLQGQMRPDLIASEVVELCRDSEKREAMLEKLDDVRQRLGTPGASQRAAEVVCGVLEGSGQSPAPYPAEHPKLVNADG